MVWRSDRASFTLLYLLCILVLLAARRDQGTDTLVFLHLPPVINLNQGLESPTNKGPGISFFQKRKDETGKLSDSQPF